jgi:hypothetical protein
MQGLARATGSMKIEFVKAKGAGAWAWEANSVKLT